MWMKSMVSAHGISLLQQLLIMVHHSWGFELENISISSWRESPAVLGEQRCDGRASVLCVSRELTSPSSGLKPALSHHVNTTWEHPTGQITGFFVVVRKWQGAEVLATSTSWSLRVSDSSASLPVQSLAFPWQYLQDTRRQWWLCDANQSCQV